MCLRQQDRKINPHLPPREQGGEAVSATGQEPPLCKENKKIWGEGGSL